MNSQKYIQIDDEGFFHSDGQRITEAAFARQLLESLEKTEFGSFTCTHDNHKIVVEAFDEPFIVAQIHPQEGFIWRAQTPYNFSFEFNLNTLTLDDWDRFHGYSESGIPFVLSRSAQADFFNLVDEFDDDSITVQGQKIIVPTMFNKDIDTQPSDYWSKIYRDEERPGWEMQEANPALISSLAQLKLPVSRILVPGCGSGNDAAYLAEQGHIVTALDYSEVAISQAREKYGTLKNLNLLQADFFEFAQAHKNQFDIVLEHTFYCALPPTRRDEYVKTIKSCLDERGKLLALYFVMDRQHHPPWGSTEWELRQRLKKSFELLYWTRWKESVGFRQGIELVVCAQKNN